MVETLISSLKPIGNIVLICCAFFIIFGILGVQVRGTQAGQALGTWVGSVGGEEAHPAAQVSRPCARWSPVEQPGSLPAVSSIQGRETDWAQMAERKAGWVNGITGVQSMQEHRAGLGSEGRTAWRRWPLH